MPRYITFGGRLSGRDLTAVRRPRPTYSKSTLASMRKAELEELAGAAGIDTEGAKKADLVDKLAPQDADE